MLGSPEGMPALSAPSVPLSQVGRAVNDIGLAGLLGGQLYGRLALHPAVAEVADPRERGKVVNRAWSRYGVIQGLSLLAVVGGWAGARAAEARPSRLGAREKRLALAKDVLTGTSAAAGLATAATGMRFARSAHGGAVPLRDGDHTAPEADERQRVLKRRVNSLSTLAIASEAALVAVNAALAQRNFRRPPLRRALRIGV